MYAYPYPIAKAKDKEKNRIEMNYSNSLFQFILYYSMLNVLCPRFDVRLTMLICFGTFKDAPGLWYQSHRGGAGVQRAATE